MQKPATEVELKLRLVDPSSWHMILDSPDIAPVAESLRQERLEAVYFDTPARTLQHHRIAFRIRKENGALVATVKAGGGSAGGLHERPEWNVVVDRPEPDIACFDNTGAQPLLAAVAAEPLQPIFTTAFDRVRLDIQTPDGSLVEAAIDTGQIIAGDRREPIAEIELELKSGNASALLELGARVAAKVPVLTEPRSKYSRALRLAGLAAGDEAPADPPLPAKTGPAADGLKLLIINEIHAVLHAQEAFLAAAAPPEPLRRLHSRLVRLQALLALAEPLARPGTYKTHQEEAGAFVAALEPLRDTLAILDFWTGMIRDAALELKPPPWLGGMLDGERNKLAADAAARLCQGTLTAAMLSLWAWLISEKSLTLPAQATLEEYAAARVGERLENLRAIGKTLSLGDQSALRSLHSQGERLRLILDSLRFEDRGTRSLLARLRRLLDCLETLLDIQTLAAALAAMANDHASRHLHRDIGLLTGWTAHIGCQNRETAPRAWRRFRRAARRWLRRAAGK